MGLLQQACKTYETHAHLAGAIPPEGQEPLCPIAHIIQKAHITVELDLNGTFINASVVDKKDADTIIPATEKSASRTSGTEAHPLCDQICYVSAEDLPKHQKYLDALSAWESSEYTHPQLTAVLAYVRGGTLLSDLHRAIPEIELDANGKLKSGKLNGVEYGKCLIRWTVEGVRCWQDAALFDAYQRYNAATMDGPRGLCMLSGLTDVLVSSHDKGIIAAINSAKLISANDERNFTYRGRFTNIDQALTIGYAASQMAHKALRWIAQNQGVNMGGRTFVCWNPQGNPVIQPTHVLKSFIRMSEKPPTPTDYQKQLKDVLWGYRNNLPPNEHVIIAAFDAATTGRMAITYYNELTRSDFLDRVEHWYATCCFPNGIYGTQSPDIWRLAHLTYGTQRQEDVKADDRVVKEASQRLFRCIVDGAPVPQDIVRKLVLNASQPQRYESNSQWKLLHASCALVRKYRNDLAQKEEWTMSLDPYKKDRSYQFGRLLAVMELAERATYDRDEQREPNALKFRSRFREQPFATAARIDLALDPYFKKMAPGLAKYFKDRISAIMQEITSCSTPDELNRTLEDTYLLGYYLERTARSSKADETNETEDENNDNA